MIELPANSSNTLRDLPLANMLRRLQVMDVEVIELTINRVHVVPQQRKCRRRERPFRGAKSSSEKR